MIALTKTGTGTFTLTGTSTYGGTTAVNGGTLEFKNAGGSTRSQTFAALAFAGADGTLQSTWDGGGSISTTFSSLTARTAGNTGNIVLNGGTPGTNNTLTINGGTAGTMMDRGVFFNGSSYAAYGTSGVIRAYGTAIRTMSKLPVAPRSAPVRLQTMWRSRARSRLRIPRPSTPSIWGPTT